MPTVSIRDLANNASRVVADVTTSGRPAILTKHGQPIAAVVAINQTDLEDFVLANAPEFVEGRRLADAELAGRQTRSLESILSELDEG